MADGNGPFAEFLTAPVPPFTPIPVPVWVAGTEVIDAKHVTVARCPSPEKAIQLAYIINAHSGSL